MVKLFLFAQKKNICISGLFFRLFCKIWVLKKERFWLLCSLGPAVQLIYVYICRNLLHNPRWRICIIHVLPLRSQTDPLCNVRDFTASGIDNEIWYLPLRRGERQLPYATDWIPTSLCLLLLLLLLINIREL